ncbi:hypothetical protein C8035_v009808 [Colletotrichum spinosum]|uniref:Uncharacterized protein n=1 Tax=Colletotrichum spinosum TaxID=1347390 RepID=A0A4R8QGQ1_9PEZI|nr:hypothetical protein C8035_v009808 [Colletotrichum spinosum]
MGVPYSGPNIPSASQSLEGATKRYSFGMSRDAAYFIMKFVDAFDDLQQVFATFAACVKQHLGSIPTSSLHTRFRSYLLNEDGLGGGMDHQDWQDSVLYNALDHLDQKDCAVVYNYIALSMASSN